MKAKILDNKKSFKPVKIELTIETKEEYDKLNNLIFSWNDSDVVLSDFDFSSDDERVLGLLFDTMAGVFGVSW